MLDWTIHPPMWWMLGGITLGVVLWAIGIECLELYDRWHHR